HRYRGLPGKFRRGQTCRPCRSVPCALFGGGQASRPAAQEEEKDPGAAGARVGAASRGGVLLPAVLRPAADNERGGLAMRGQLRELGPSKWLVRIFVGRDKYVKRIVRSKTVNGAKTEAQIVLTRMLADLDAGKFAVNQQQTGGEYLAAWLETAAKPRL